MTIWLASYDDCSNYIVAYKDKQTAIEQTTNIVWADVQDWGYDENELKTLHYTKEDITKSLTEHLNWYDGIEYYVSIQELNVIE